MIFSILWLWHLEIQVETNNNCHFIVFDRKLTQRWKPLIVAILKGFTDVKELDLIYWLVFIFIINRKCYSRQHKRNKLFSVARTICSFSFPSRDGHFYFERFHGYVVFCLTVFCILSLSTCIKGGFVNQQLLLIKRIEEGIEGINKIKYMLMILFDFHYERYSKVIRIKCWTSINLTTIITETR